MREFRPSVALLAVLLASVAGCASSLRFADRPAVAASFVNRRRTDGQTPLIATPPDGETGIPSYLQPTIEQLGANSCLEPQQPLHNLFDNVMDDHANYYSRRNLGMLAVGVGVAAIMANTRLDEAIQNNYQEDLRDLHTDEFSEALHTPSFLGNGYVTIPAFCGAALVGSWYDDTPLGHGSSEWGQRCLRTVLVGGPPMLAMQVVTGASRPGETDRGSLWNPFQDNNGVSGHSFMGAVPFISAAKMTDDPFWKAAFYAGSTLAALSRINDDRHYPSQVMLGWWMAYVAATAVDDTEQGNLTVFPLLMDDGIGAGLEYRW